MRFWPMLLGIAVLALNGVASAADKAPPPIRDFDLATIEKLGREIYAQDQLAWKATDVVYAERTQTLALKEGLKGWIVENVDGKDVVRFIKPGGRVPEALYDVTFTNGAEPVFSIPSNKALRPEEVAQYNARELAVKNIDMRCSDAYNTVVLKDPQGDGWIAWALAATVDPDLIIVGGHYRFTISADGKRIRQKDALFRGCAEFSKMALTAGAKELPKPDLAISHIVSLTPVETHVFLALNYNVVIHVGTDDGRAWRIDDGSVKTIDQDEPGADGAAARGLAGLAEKCALQGSKSDTPDKIESISNDFHVITATENAVFAINPPAGFKVRFLLCGRQDIVPAPNDYKVLRAGYVLYIFDNGVGHPERAAALEMVKGQLQFRLIKGGGFTNELQARLKARLNAMQTALNSAP